MTNAYDECSDEELLTRLRNGEADILDYIMEKYKGAVRQKARAMFLVGGETDDLIQEGMVGLFKAVRDFDQNRDASFATFARLCIERQMYTAVQNSNRQKHQPLNGYVSLSEETVEIPDSENWRDNPETILLDQESAGLRMQQILDSLSPMECQVLAAYLEGGSYTKIANRLGKSEKSVDNALRRIRIKIRSQIQPI